MDWPNERYVRVYTRDTTTWKLMDWRGRTVLSLLFRKVDRAGVLDVGHDGVLGLAAVLELPIDIVEAGIAQLTTARGGTPTVVDTGTAYVLPNFLEAQEAPQADAQRKRESRSRRRDVALAVSRNLLPASASEPVGHETGRNRPVESQPVTPIRSDPSRSNPDLSLSRAIPPAPEYPTRHGMGPAGESPAPLPITPPARDPHDGPTLDQLWTELELARQRAAAHHRVTLRPLLAHDHGRSELAEALSTAAMQGQRAQLAASCLDAIATAEAAAIADRKQLQWLSGAVFAPRNLRRLAAAPAPKARRDTKPAAQPIAEPPPVTRKRSAEEIAELSAMASTVASLPTAELVKRFGDPEARAGPTSAPPTTDEQPEPAKDTA